MKQRKVWSVSCQELDSIVLNRLFNLTQQDTDMVEGVKAFWESRKTEEVDAAQVLRQQIKKARDQIARLDGLLTNPARPLSKATEERYLAMLNEAEADLTQLQRKLVEQQEIEEPQSIISNFYYVLSHLPTEYKKLDSEHQKKMIRKVIKSIRLNLYPLIFSCSISNGKTG